MGKELTSTNKRVSNFRNYNDLMADWKFFLTSHLIEPTNCNEKCIACNIFSTKKRSLMPAFPGKKWSGSRRWQWTEKENTGRCCVAENYVQMKKKRETPGMKVNYAVGRVMCGEAFDNRQW